MQSTITTPISGRIPSQQVAPFRAQAARFGLTTSQAIATLVAGALAVEAAGPGPTSETEATR